MMKHKVVEAGVLSRYFATMLLTFVAGVICGGIMLVDEHPYDRCMLTYTVPEDIIECVWLLSSNTNPEVIVGNAYKW